MKNNFTESYNYFPMYKLIQPLWPGESDESVRPKSSWDTTVPPQVLLESQPGCVLGCIYCNQQWMDRNEQGERDSGILSPGDAGLTINLRVNFGIRTVKQVTIDQVIDLLKNYPLYKREGSILIGNYTDPGLNWGESCELATRIVDEYNHSGPILFITKMPVGKRSLEYLQGLQKKGGNVVVVVTYSGMPEAIEPASSQKRIDALKIMHEGGIPTILSMRPMIPDINGEPETISKVLSECWPYADAVIYGGLFVYPNTRDLFSNAGHPLPDSYANHNYTVAKKTEEVIGTTIRNEARLIGVNIPIYEHTNCAVAYIMGEKYLKKTWNKLAHWVIDAPSGKHTSFRHCAKICPPKQMSNCVERSRVSPDIMIAEISSALLDLNLFPVSSFNSGTIEIVQSDRIPSLYLIKNAILNVLQLFQVMEKVGVRIDNFPNREQFVMRSVEAIKTHLGENEKKILGAVQFGQEWVLLVDGDLTEDDNDLATKYVRTNTRCRSNVLDIKKFEDKVALKEWMSKRNYLNYFGELEIVLSQLLTKYQR